MSIATKRGDGGKTSLVGGVRVSKGELRVETYGTIDELNSVMGFARSICGDAEICDTVKRIQRELFKVGSALASAPGGRQAPPPITAEMVEALTQEVHRIEAIDGVLADWSLAGEHPASAAFDVARTVCRRAERLLVRLQDSGAALDPKLLAYINRLSDLLWLCGRLIDARAGLDATLRDPAQGGKRWSRAW